MKKVVYIWKNYGMMRIGHDIAELKVEITANSMVISIDAEEFEIKDKEIFAFSNNIDCQKILSSLEKVKFPKEKKYNADGCDGDAWELYIDNEKYEGYLIKPDFLKEVFMTQIKPMEKKLFKVSNLSVLNCF